MNSSQEQFSRLLNLTRKTGCAQTILNYENSKQQYQLGGSMLSKSPESISHKLSSPVHVAGVRNSYEKTLASGRYDEFYTSARQKQ